MIDCPAANDRWVGISGVASTHNGKPCRTRWALAPLDHLAGAAMARKSAFVNDQWQQPGVNPMIVRYPAAEPFVRDPSHLVQREDCKHRTRPRLSQALAKLAGVPGTIRSRVLF